MSRSKTSLSVFALAGALIVPAVFACDTGGDADAVLELVDDALEMENEAIAIICDCWEELEIGDSKNDCLDDQILPSQRRCIEDAYLRDAAASRIYLDCLVPLQAELNACLDDKLECSDVGPTHVCFEDFDLGLESCIEPPNSVERGLGECYGDSGLYGSDSGGEPAPSDSGSDPEPGGTTGTSGPGDGDPPGDSAEEGGGEVGEPPVEDSGSTCQPGDFVCGDDSCIPAGWECDDYEDCPGGEDELECGGTATTGFACDDTTFECGDGSCIPGDWECDDYTDCADGEDEANCEGPSADGDDGGESGGGPVPPG